MIRWYNNRHEFSGAEKIIIANWKMNPVEPEMAKRLYTSTRQTALGLNRVQVLWRHQIFFLGILAGNRASKSKACARGARRARGTFGRLHGRSFTSDG